MDTTVLQQILAALGSKHYLGLAIVLTLYLRKLASSDSKFPFTIRTTWLPSVSAFGGLVYGFESSLQGGASAGAAALGALAVAASTGFFDGLVTAIWANGNAPRWAQALVFLIDDIDSVSGSASGGGSVQGSGATPAAKAPADAIKTDPPKRPSASARRGLIYSRTMAIVGLMLMLLPGIVLLFAGRTPTAGCGAALAAVTPALDCGVAIIEDAVSGLSISEIVAKELARCGADEAQVVAILLESKDPRLAGTKAMLAALAIRPASVDGGSK